MSIIKMHLRGLRAQSILEFSAGMVVLCLIIFGMIQIFRWGMVDMVERRYDHETLLMNMDVTSQQQTAKDFHKLRPMDAVVYKPGL